MRFRDNPARRLRVRAFTIAIIVASAGGMLPAHRAAADNGGVVTNVRAAPRANTGLLDITYDLLMADGNSVAVRVYASFDGGRSFPHLCRNVTGDVGDDVMPGIGHRIIWGIGAEFPGLTSTSCRVRVTADDRIRDGDLRTIVLTTQDPTDFIYPLKATPTDSARVRALINEIENADAVYRLGAGFDVPSFAYAEIGAGNPDGTRDPDGVSVGWASAPPEALTGIHALNLRFPQIERRAELVYIPWSSILPHDVTIVSALLNVQLSHEAAFCFTDSIIAVQVDGRDDDQWYLTKGMGTELPDCAHAAWSRQRSSNHDSWGGNDAFPWSPALNERRHLWDWGEANDWTGTTNYLRPGTVDRGSQIAVKITNCVQSVVSGGSNNGILICCAAFTSDTATIRHYGWDDTGNARGRTPYVIIRYRDQAFTPAFGTSDWAFVASTDDGKYAANSAYVDTFTAHGGKYTIFVSRRQVGSGYGAATAVQIMGFQQRGMEIGNHSRYHKDPLGLTYWTQQMAMTDTNAAAWDSLLFDVSPRWMYAMADTIVGDLRPDQRFAKSFALPNNTWSPEVLLALEKTGYRAIRTGTAGGLYNRDCYFVPATRRPGKTDTLMTGVPTQFDKRPRNLIGLPTSMTMQLIAGYKRNPATTAASLDSLRTNLHRAIFQLRGQDRRALSLFWHDFKTNPSGPGYNEGVNPNELGALLGVVDALKGRYMTASEYTSWLMARATAVATPASYAQPDTFKVPASAGIWFVPGP